MGLLMLVFISSLVLAIDTEVSYSSSYNDHGCPGSFGKKKKSNQEDMFGDFGISVSHASQGLSSCVQIQTYATGVKQC